MVAVVWGTEPDEHDYPAAADYLALLATAAQINEILAALKQCPYRAQKGQGSVARIAPDAAAAR